MAEAVGDVLGMVPVLDAEVRGPAGVVDFLLRNFLPCLAVLDLKTDLIGFVGHEGKELCGELEGLVSNGVNGKSNNVFARDIELDELAGALSFAVGLHSLFPPLTGGAAIELGKLFSKDFGGSGHHLAMGSGGEDEEED